VFTTCPFSLLIYILNESPHNSRIILFLSEREEENMNGDMWRNLSAS